MVSKAGSATFELKEGLLAGGVHPKMVKDL